MFQTKSGRPVSSYSFGAMQFGGNADETASAEMYSACREAGINFFDTAFAYTEGKSERILGALVAPERDDIFVATKCAPTGNGVGYINDQFAQCLDRLAMDSVDLLYLHKWDDSTPLEESFAALAAHVASGAVRHIGVSNYSAWQVMKAQRIANDLDLTISFIQPMYNLVKRQVEVEILPMAASEGFAICPYSPLGGGLLTGKYVSGTAGRLADSKMYNARYAPTWMGEVAAELLSLANERGVSAATLAVAWVARNAAVHGPIISARSVEQLQPSLDAMSFEMDDELYAKITALSPTPAPATDRLEES